MIKGGYILHARKIKDSPVIRMAPCTREVWFYILREAYFADYQSLKRGQFFTKIDDIREDLQWYVGFRKNMYTRRQVEGAFESLRKVGMIVTMKVTHGIVITVCKYDYYQDQNNYERGSECGNEDSMSVTRTFYEGHNNNIKKNKEKEYNRGEGDLASPSIPAPSSVNGFNYLADGRSYIEPTVFFTKEDFNGLPKDNNDAIRTFLVATKKVEVEPEKIDDLWQVFKIQELTFQKPYRNKDDVYRHFLNWAKKQTFSKTAAPRQKTETKKAEEKTTPTNLKTLISRYD